MSINRTCAIANFTCGAGSEGMLGSLTRSGESDERGRSASEHPPECISGARFKDGTPVDSQTGNRLPRMANHLVSDDLFPTAHRNFKTEVPWFCAVATSIGWRA